MKPWFILISGIISFACSPARETKNDLLLVDGAVGVIALNKFNRGDSIRIENEDGSLWYGFTFYYEDDGKSFVLHDHFAPFAFHPDYFLIVLKCKGITDKRSSDKPLRDSAQS